MRLLVESQLIRACTLKIIQRLNTTPVWRDMSALCLPREGAVSWGIHHASKTCCMSRCRHRNSRRCQPLLQSHWICTTRALSQHNQSFSTRCIIFINICSSFRPIRNLMWSKRKFRTRITSPHLTISLILWALIWVHQSCQASPERQV